MPSPKLPSGQISKWKEVDYLSVYSNMMGFGMSPFDISIVFGEISESSSTEVIGTPRVKVTVTPEQAANLMKLLGVALNTYVKSNGNLRSAGAVNAEEVQSQMDENLVKP